MNSHLVNVQAEVGELWRAADWKPAPITYQQMAATVDAFLADLMPRLDQAMAENAAQGSPRSEEIEAALIVAHAAQDAQEAFRAMMEGTMAPDAAVAVAVASMRTLGVPVPAINKALGPVTPPGSPN